MLFADSPSEIGYQIRAKLNLTSSYCNYNGGMRARRLTPILIVLVLAIILGVAYQQMTPQVVAFSPADEATGVFADTPIRLEFSREMDMDSVSENLSIVPATPGELVWEQQTLLFIPDDPWTQGSVFEVRLGSEARSSLGLAMSDELQWSFTIGRPLLAYLYPADGPSDIYALDIVSGDIMRFTTTRGVLDFDIGPQGIKIYYSAINQAGGSDIYLYDRKLGESVIILDCGAARCRNPQIHPNQPVIAYERLGTNSSGASQVNQIWLISDLSTGETEPLISRGETRLPQWSSKGWLSYYRQDLKRFVLVNIETGERISFSNKTGDVGVWLPDGKTFIALELFATQLDTLRGPSGEAQNDEVDEADLESVGTVSSHLISFDLESGQMMDLTRDSNLEDIAPAASPNGRLLAMARKYIDERRWTPGRQLWLMSPNGTGAFNLTNDLDFIHTAFAWHPNGQSIAFVRFNQVEMTDPPELWVIDSDGRNAIQLIIGGYAPQWIP